MPWMGNDLREYLDGSLGKVDRLPNIFECATYLQLLDAIVLLKREVDEWGEERGIAEGEAWDLFSNLAARRFLKWSQNIEFQEHVTPSLDILMVWQAYMLNPRAYHHYETKVLRSSLGGRGINWVALVSVQQTFRLRRCFGKLVTNWCFKHECMDKDNGAFVLSVGDESGMTRLSLHPDLLKGLKTGQIPNDVEDSHRPLALKFDLVAAVQRQLKFAEKMHHADWIQSPFAQAILESAIDRYEKFFTLIAEYPGSPLSPTLDIDLAWHTHQLSPRSYGRFINHDDTVDKESLTISFDNSQTIFRQRFNLEYLLCHCWNCERSRAKKLRGAEFTNFCGDSINNPSSSCNSNCNNCQTNCNSSCDPSCSGSSCHPASCSGGPDGDF
jgi:hypothetical protein